MKMLGRLNAAYISSKRTFTPDQIQHGEYCRQTCYLVALMRPIIKQVAKQVYKWCKYGFESLYNVDIVYQASITKNSVYIN